MFLAVGASAKGHPAGMFPVLEDGKHKNYKSVGIFPGHLYFYATCRIDTESLLASKRINKFYYHFFLCIGQ
jgi:hypothetical protein